MCICTDLSISDSFATIDAVVVFPVPGEPWKALVREHYEVHYIILRASKEETLKRAVERSKLDRKTNIELVETMWEQFCNLGIYESNVVDTTNYSIQETVSAVQEKIASRAALLS